MFPIKSMPTPTANDRMAASSLEFINVKIVKNTIGVKINESMNGENIIKYSFQNGFILVRLYICWMV
ncbi:MAG: hypothetical protein QXP32_05550 [Nitrososphaeria archaeon]